MPQHAVDKHFRLSRYQPVAAGCVLQITTLINLVDDLVHGRAVQSLAKLLLRRRHS